MKESTLQTHSYGQMFTFMLMFTFTLILMLMFTLVEKMVKYGGERKMMKEKEKGERKETKETGSALREIKGEHDETGFLGVKSLRVNGRNL